MPEPNPVIQDIFSSIASKFPCRVALQAKENNHYRCLTYKQLAISSRKIAAFLIKQGLKKGDFAALILENRPEWAIIYLGIVFSAGSCVPLDSQLTSQELKNLISDSGAKFIFCSYDIFAKKIEPFLQEIKAEFILLDAPEDSLSLRGVLDTKCQGRRSNLIRFSTIETTDIGTVVFPEVSPDDTASLIYTSGTTQKPKGVLLTHKNICSNFKSIEKLDICKPSDNILAILPLYHTYAFMVTLITPLFLGAKATFFKLSLKPSDITSVIKEADVTLLAGVPQFFAMLNKAIFEELKKIPRIFLPLFLPFIRVKLHKRLGKSLRLFVCGGARLEPRIAKDLHRFGFRLIEGYGLTETSPIVTLNHPEKVKFGSVGRPIPDVEIRIDSPDTSGVGEVTIKGPNVMKGYFRQPQLTEGAIKDGWFYSGDLGYINKEGYLFLTGRKKEIIVLSSGKNIYPEELEEYYGRSPYIKELCILSRAEEQFGHTIESLYAVVVPNLEYFKEKGEADIKGKIRWELENSAKDLPVYKHIMGFVLTKEDLPRTPLKKLKRYQVEQKYIREKIAGISHIEETALSKQDSELLGKELSAKVINYISGQLKRPVSLDSHLEIDLGIDSLSKVELGLGLESLFSIKIPDETLYEVSTVRDIIIRVAQIIEQKKPGEEPGETQKTWKQILYEAPNEEILKEIRIGASLLDKILALFFQNIILFILRLFWLLRIEGREFLPRSGPYIICPNHASYLDGFVVFSSLMFRQAVNIFFVGYSKIFEHPLINWSIKPARLIPIDPSLHLTEALQGVSLVLTHRKIACIFPEGRRSVDENLGEFKKGVGILIKELDVPVVPVYIKGSHKSWPRTSRFPRFCRIKIIFGRPRAAKDLIAKVRAGTFADDYEAIAQGLREEVLSLI